MRTKQVRITTLKKIYKEIRKCDSLYVAYDSQTTTLNELTSSNELMLSDLLKERKKVAFAEKQIVDINKELKKKKRNTSIYSLGSVIVGLTIGVLLTR